MDITVIFDNILHWVSTSGVKLVFGLIGLWIGWKAVNKGLKTLNTLLKKQNIDLTLVSFFHAFADIALKVLLVIVFMGFVGIPTAGFAALLASAGLAVGLALQGSLSNFAGGVIILLLRPVQVGNYIETSSYQGTVEKIGIFYSHLVTADNREILIPNGALANGSLINYSSKPLRRVDLTFSVGYNDDILKVKTILNKIIDNNPLILKDPAPFVAVSEHAASSINFIVRAWCDTENYWIIYFDLLETVKIEFDNNNISIPYPQMDLHMQKSE
ncbi:mechanosensitive ion channel [Clostridium sardiniense]|uniref:mechanosensitive ion channel family protein n=1 Tax=Clostridium sardiniense TaxID=29369 RepID=UPI00195C3565|nr:mechanosensitive ion channel domain-containing protein [Clostridium sardiniense]MBM7835209.1 small conductance mechanosensitive channel [Clostridium sardiniense]